MKKSNIFSKRMIGLTLAGLVPLLLACPSMKSAEIPPPATVPGAEYIGMESCALCHAETVKDFKYARHAKLKVTLPDGKEVLGCESCHGAGSLHMAAGGGRGVSIINPKKNPETCFQCHPEIKTYQSFQYHHPMNEKGVGCVDCHSPHGQNIMLPGNQMVGQDNAPCGQCHQDQGRPFVFEHEALREGCTTCHNQHGSINDKLLVANDANLCLRCHAQISAAGSIELGDQNHTSRLTQGPCWAAGCHTAVHGSNMNAHLRY